MINFANIDQNYLKIEPSNFICLKISFIFHLIDMPFKIIFDTTTSYKKNRKMNIYQLQINKNLALQMYFQKTSSQIFCLQIGLYIFILKKLVSYFILFA